MSEHTSEVPPPLPQRRTRTVKPARGKLVFRSEEPFEESVSKTKRHLEARTTLYLVLRKAYELHLAAKKRHQEMKKVAIGSEQFVYYDVNDPKKCFSPDVFVKLDSEARDFDTWHVWERGSIDLVVEIVSESDRENDTWSDKFTRYQQSGVREVVRFDALAPAAITVWDRVGTELVKRTATGSSPPECKVLGLYWTVQKDATYGPQLRLAKDRAGKQLLPTPSENETRLEQELADERRARARAEHDKKLAEQKQQEEAEMRGQLEAEVARLRAELEQYQKGRP
jgi:Uma2 family endonuclease